MRIQRTSPSFNYLTEIVIAILIFALTSIISLTFFVRAQMIYQDNDNKEQSLLVAQNCIEQLKYQISESNLASTDGTWTYDNTLQVNEFGNYQVQWELTQTSIMYEGIVKVFVNDAMIVTLPFALPLQESSL